MTIMLIKQLSRAKVTSIDVERVKKTRIIITKSSVITLSSLKLPGLQSTV